MQKGVTLLELLTVLALLGFIAGLAAPALVGWSDRLSVGRAVEEVMGFHRRARLQAVFGSLFVREAITPDSMIATVLGAPDSVIARGAGPRRLGVSLVASRSVIRIYPNGLGLGGSNTKIVLRKGAAAESLTVSRLGRIRRWP